jgi:two-component system CheB/CheR fusion protein
MDMAPTQAFPCFGMTANTRFLCEAQLLGVLAEGLPGLLAYVDGGLRVAFMAGVAERWLGRGPEACLGLPMAELFGEAAPLLAPQLQAALAGGRVEFEMSARMRDPAVTHLRGVSYPDRDREGQVRGCFLLLLDMTRERAFEQQLREARDTALEANRSKSRFLLAASHDLRQPLQAMTLFVSALQRRIREPEPRRLLADVDGALASLRSMLDALLDLSRLEAGLVVPHPAPFAVQELMDSLTPGFQALAADHGLALRVVESSAWVLADRTLIETSLRNLLGNALKFTRSGRVLVGVRRRGPHVGLVVADTGVGIEADRLVDIFQEFARTAETPRGSNDGIGLGLAIVRRLVSLHGGEVTVRSQPGRGTIFTLWLPAAEPAKHGAPAGEPISGMDRALAGHSLLVLDDDAACAAAIAQDLADHGAHVAMAASGAEAQRMIAAGLAPDAIVVDFSLGGSAHGLDFLASLPVLPCAGRPLARLPGAVVLTGSTDATTLARLRESPWRWLTKPVESRVLLGAVRVALSARAGSP